MAWVTFAVESLLDALLMRPEERAALELGMSARFMQWCGENGFPVAKVNADGEREMLGEVVPFPTPREPEAD